jgi:hypothetical protein
MSRKVNIQSYADYFGVSRQAIHAWLRKYIDAEKGKYNPYDMTSVFAFFEYLQKQFSHGRRFFHNNSSLL